MLHLLDAAAALGSVVVPNPPAAAPPGVGAKVDVLLGWLKWGGLIAGVAGLLVCGIMMMIGRRNRSAMAADGAARIPWVLGGLTLVAFSASLVGAAASS